MSIQQRLILITVLALSATHLQAQDDDDNEYTGKNGIAKINVLGLLGGQYQFAFEKKRTHYVTFQASLGLIAGNRNFTGYLDSAKTKSITFKGRKLGFIFIPEVRYYFRGNAAHGTYMAGLLRFRHSTEDQSDNAHLINNNMASVSRKQSLTSMGGGINIGYQKAKGKMTLDVFAGLVFTSVTERNTYFNGSASYNDLINRYSAYRNLDQAGVSPRFGFFLGIKI